MHRLASALDDVIDCVRRASRTCWSCCRIAEASAPVRRSWSRSSAERRRRSARRSRTPIAAPARGRHRRDQAGGARGRLGLPARRRGAVLGRLRPMQVLMWKDLLHQGETAIDKCEDIANTIESVLPSSHDDLGRHHHRHRVGVRLLQRLPRCRELDRHRRLHPGALAAASRGVGGVLQLRGLHDLRHEGGGDDRERRGEPCGAQQRRDLRRRWSGRSAWDIITWWIGLPTSSSHALVGAMAGAAVAEGRVGCAGRERVPEDRRVHRALADRGLAACRSRSWSGSIGSSIGVRSSRSSTAGSGGASCSPPPRSAWRTARTTRRRRWASSWRC